MSQLVGKRMKITLNVGVDKSGSPAFEVNGTEVDAGAVRGMDPHVSMQVVSRALGLYMKILADSLPREAPPQIMVPTGAMPNLRSN